MEEFKTAEQKLLDMGYEKKDGGIYKHMYNPVDFFLVTKIGSYWRVFDETPYGMDEDDLGVLLQLVKELREAEEPKKIIGLVNINIEVV